MTPNSAPGFDPRFSVRPSQRPIQNAGQNSSLSRDYSEQFVTIAALEQAGRSPLRDQQSNNNSPKALQNNRDWLA